MSEINRNNIWWKLKGAWVCIVKNLPYQFIPFVGLVFGGLIFADEIGIIIKVNKLKKQLPDRVEFRNFFKNYIIGIFVPIVGQFFWSRAINDIMKYLGTKGIKQEEISYIEKKGKIYGIVGIIGELIGFIGGAVLYVFLFLPTFRNMYSPYSSVLLMEFFLIDFTIEFIKTTAFYILLSFAFILPYWIISVILRIKILNRLIFCIDRSGLF